LGFVRAVVLAKRLISTLHIAAYLQGRFPLRQTVAAQFEMLNSAARIADNRGVLVWNACIQIY
jgi:hypothetical protein